jgi:hypothetical protein
VRQDACSQGMTEPRKEFPGPLLLRTGYCGSDCQASETALGLPWRESTGPCAGLSDFDLPDEIPERPWCPAWGVFRVLTQVELQHGHHLPRR